MTTVRDGAEVVLAVADGSVLFVAGAAAGAVAVSAAVRLAYGAWASALLPVAESGAALFRPVLAVVAILAVGGAALRGAADAAHVARAVVPLAAALVVFVPGRRFVAAARAEAPRARAAGAGYLACFAVGLSTWTGAFAFGDAPGSTVAGVPAASLVAALLSGLAWTALVAAAQGEVGPEVRRDVGRLLFALVALWAYLLWALYLPTWYANVPHEAAFLLARWSPPHRPLAAAVLGSIAAALALLFPSPLPRARRTLACVSAILLVALWLERLLLVLPARALAADASSVIVGAFAASGAAGLLLLVTGLRRAPRPRRRTAEDLASPHGG